MSSTTKYTKMRAVEELREERVVEEIRIITSNRLRGFSKRLDEKDVLILTRFYPPNQKETCPYCFPILVQELQASGMKIRSPMIRVRINRLAEYGYVEKVESSNPQSFFPLRDELLIDVIKNILVNFFRKNKIL